MCSYWDNQRLFESPTLDLLIQKVISTTAPVSHHLITVRPQAIYTWRHGSQHLNRLEIYLQSSSKDGTGDDSESSDHLSAGRVCSSGEWNCGALFGVSRRPEGRKSTLDRGNIYSGVTSSRSDAAGGVGGVSRSDCGAHS